jgi:hypothetical protein
MSRINYGYVQNDKVLYAEASKAVIDFLFNLLCLPIGTVVKLLTTNDMVGSLGNLYQSVENLNQNYMLPFQTKDALLNPRAQSSSTEISGFLTWNEVNDDHDEETKLYISYTCARINVIFRWHMITLLDVLLIVMATVLVAGII